jgi:hypothetical protein
MEATLTLQINSLTNKTSTVTFTILHKTSVKGNLDYFDDDNYVSWTWFAIANEADFANQNYNCSRFTAGMTLLIFRAN